MTQADLADKAGLSRVAVSHLENDLRQPRLSNARKLANALRVDVTDIFPEDR